MKRYLFVLNTCLWDSRNGLQAGVGVATELLDDSGGVVSEGTQITPYL